MFCWPVGPTGNLLVGIFQKIFFFLPSIHLPCVYIFLVFGCYFSSSVLRKRHILLWKLTASNSPVDYFFSSLFDAESYFRSPCVKSHVTSGFSPREVANSSQHKALLVIPDSELNVNLNTRGAQSVTRRAKICTFSSQRGQFQ